ncbi:S41 family peptidase [Hymenobacter gummosus]|nr:S41 family peptidase [Hymenobacter gummosus]
MLTKTLLLLGALGLPLLGWGQKIATRDALTDLTFLDRAVREAHPANYAPEAYRVDLGPVLARVQALTADSLSAVEFRLLLAEALYRVGCVHTGIRKNPLAPKAAPRYFPLQLLTLNGRLYVGADSVHQLAGAEVQTLNGVPAATLVATLHQYWASDGGGPARGEAAFNRLSASVISLYFGYPATYALTTNKQSVRVPAAPQLPPPLAPPPLAGVVLRARDNSLRLQEGAAVLRVRSFARADAAFFDQALRYVREQQVPALVIDLRGNGGGNRAAAVALARHLVDTAFSYAFVQPRQLHPFRYANATGKLYLGLAALRYTVGDAWRGRRSPLGRTYTYRYRPHAQPYRGRLFVLTDGFTASSSTMLTAWLRRHSRATFVGTAAGGGYNGNNGGTFPVLTLPRSRVEITFPAYRLVLDAASAQRTGLVPDVVPPRSINDVLQQRDVDLDAVLALLRTPAR